MPPSRFLAGRRRPSRGARPARNAEAAEASGGDVRIRFRPRRELPIARPRRRRAVRWWAGVLALAALTYAWLAGALGRAAEAEARWGQTTPVVVAVDAIPAGEALDGAVAVRRWPRALVPSGALSAMPPPGAVARHAIGEGEVVVASRVAGLAEDDGSAVRPGPLALVPTRSRVVVVPLAMPGLPAEPGDVVEVLATDRAAVVVREATVVEVRSDRVVLAVPATAAPDLAEAMGRGPVAVALTIP